MKENNITSTVEWGAPSANIKDDSIVNTKFLQFFVMISTSF